MMMFGWDSWGRSEMPGALGPARIYKHYTGVFVAVAESYEGDDFLLLSQMNEYLEDEAGVEREPTPGVHMERNRDLISWQTARDMRESLERLAAENADLRGQLGITGTAPPPEGWLRD